MCLYYIFSICVYVCVSVCVCVCVFVCVYLCIKIKENCDVQPSTLATIQFYFIEFFMFVCFCDFFIKFVCVCVSVSVSVSVCLCILKFRDKIDEQLSKTATIPNKPFAIY